MSTAVLDRPATELETEPAIGVDDATAAEMGAEVALQWQRVQREQARFTHKLRNFDLANAHAASGALTLTAWMRVNLKMTGTQAAQQLMLARQLDALPKTASALASGEISYHHAAVIASSARKLGVDVVAQHEETLVTCAKEVDPFSLSKVTEHLEHCVDPDGSLSFFERQYERRTLQLNRMADGMYALRGIFDREGGAIIASGLEALTPPRRPDDDRTAGQRRADAMVEAFTSGAEKPLLTVIAGVGTLYKQPGSPAGELRDQLTIPAEVVRRIACDCTEQHGHVCEDGIQVHLSDQVQSIPPKLRRQLELRDRHCRFPGCDRPPSQCDAHHLKHRAQGGKNVMENLALLCRRHHRYPHERRYVLSWGPGGELLAQPP